MHHLHLHSGVREVTEVKMVFQEYLSNAVAAVAAVEVVATPVVVGKLAVMVGRLAETGRLIVAETFAGVGRLAEAGRIAEFGKLAVVACWAVFAGRLAQTAAALYQWEQRVPVGLDTSAMNFVSSRTMVCLAQS